MKLWVLGAMCLVSSPMVCASQLRTIDDFDSAEGWKVIQSDQVAGTLRNVEGPDGKALCLDYDFHGVSGYVGLQRDVAIDYPGNYAFAFQLRGEGPKNDFQFKLVDASGDNVWWATKPKFALPGAWTPMQFRKRHISKAWGPSEEKALENSAKLEFTLASGEGGKGAVCFDALTFTQLPPQDDSPLTGKLSERNGEWTFDLGKSREIGGAILQWTVAPQHYALALSNDGQAWRDVFAHDNSDGARDYIALPESEARFLRVTATRSRDGERAELHGLQAQPLAFGATPNDFMRAIAKDVPAEFFVPAGFLDVQQYWTILGIDGGREHGLISEDGRIEVAKGGFSIAPLIEFDRGPTVDLMPLRAPPRASQSLQDDYLPIPTVRLQYGDHTVEVTAFADDNAGRPRLVARYRVQPREGATNDVFELRVVPFQVNPPSQFLNTVGGVSPIKSLRLDAQAIVVDGASRVALSLPAASRHVRAFDSVDVPDARVEDPVGLASGELRWPVKLAAGETFEVALSAPLDGGAPTPITNAEAAAAQERVAAQWRDKLDRVKFKLPKEGQHIADTLRTALAHMAISRVGPRLQPGTRSYSRAWIRDGAMINEGLLRLGREDIAEEFLRWYAPYQFDSGKVPCCVDDRGSDPVPENDSHGELIYAVAELYRYTRDRDLLEAMWPHVQGAVKYMDELRASERTEANRAKNPAFHGLMPASISHEGYSAKPMHSYWDDFWALRGYKDAVEIAKWLGHDEEAKRFAASRDQFSADLQASIKMAMTQHGIAFIPGSAELGDFDATSTTIALAPGAAQSILPEGALEYTFERYWREFEQRRNGTKAWKDYTPYELRTVGTFARLGWRDRAQSALEFFFDDQQPRAWNQWAEVVSRTPRKPFFVGDLPHAWVASDYVRSALDLFAFERPEDESIVLAAGIPEAWLAGEGIAIEGLRTPGGPLSYSLRDDGAHLVLDVQGDIKLPPGGLVLPWKGKETRVTRVPATIEIER